MIVQIEGQSGAEMMYSHMGSQAVPDFFLVDLDGLYFRGFMLGRPAVTGDKFAALCYSQKLAVKVAEKMARMYGRHFAVVPAKCAAERRAAAGVPELVTPPSNTGVNNGQPVARGDFVRVYEKSVFSADEGWERYEESQLMSGDK